MVSKTVVAALVIIVACPILLGYAMNLNEVNETGYKPSGESVNVTPLLRTSTDYNYAASDPLQMNNNARFSGEKVLPVYERITTAKTTYPLTQNFTSWSASGVLYLTDFSMYYVYPQYDHSLVSVAFNVNDSNGQALVTVGGLVSLYYVAADSTVYYTYLVGNTQYANHITHPDITSILFVPSQPVSLTTYISVQYKTGNSNYVDVSAGFHFEDSFLGDSSYYNIWLPTNTKRTILTVNLDSITDGYYTFAANSTRFTKTTVGGVVSWKVTTPSNEVIDLYYNPAGGNTYQIYTDYDTYSPGTVELRYVGAWPTLIGEANYYQKYSYEIAAGGYNQNITIHNLSALKTPIMRMDYAEYLAFETPIIENNTYTPGSYKANPQTTIKNPTLYGTSLTFGGNTYPVTNGTISLDGHDIPVKDIVLSSVPDGNGAYQNKIGNTVISTTANPSTITFNGKWSVSVSTQSLESYSVTKTSWTPGEFAWDGIDQNFLMIGMLAALGAFIGLGIAVRRAKASILPLILVCGGAAAVFFIML